MAQSVQTVLAGRSGTVSKAIMRPSGAPRIAERLEAFGYSPSVAAQIAAARPELAQRILATPIDHQGTRAIRVHEPIDLMNFGPMDGRPLKLYRGVCLPLHKLDLGFKDAPRGIPGLSFFSKEISEPNRYASGDALREREKALARGDVTGTIVEIEVPNFLVYFYGHPVLRAVDVEDLAPFIARRSEVDLRTPPRLVLSPEQLRWTTPSAHFKKD